MYEVANGEVQRVRTRAECITECIAAFHFHFHCVWSSIQINLGNEVRGRRNTSYIALKILTLKGKEGDLSLSTIWRPTGGAHLYFQSLVLTSVPDGAELSTWGPGRLSPGKEHRCTSNKRLSEPQSRSDRYGAEKNLFLLQACILVTTSPTLLRLPFTSLILAS